MHILPIYTIDKDTGSIVHPSLLISRQHRSLLGKTIRSQRLFLFERPRLHALLNDSCQFFLLNQSRNNRIPTTSFIIHAATPCNVFFSRKGWHYDILFSPFMSKCGRRAWSMSLYRSHEFSTSFIRPHIGPYSFQTYMNIYIIENYVCIAQ